ncbi:MAG: hypothetical protein P4M09_20255 [Devosia sp.]|nr:hypothetical protein [Devosia sp.]
MPATRFAGLPRAAIVIAVVAALLATIALVYIALIHQDPPVDPARGSDRDMYARLIDHMRHGVDYYAAARQELSEGQYGMQSVFNWRTPFYASFLALFPALVWPQALIIALAGIAAALACKLMFDELGWIGAGVLVIAEILSLGACLVPRSFLLSEIPTGVLILLSASLYGLRRPGIGQGVAVLALFVRELAAPYVLVCAFLAWRERRYRELAGWIVALLVYAAYFLWHYEMVKLHTLPTDHGDPSSWLQFGGVDFVLNTAAFNGFFLVAPLWVSALVAPAAYLGLLAWPGQAGNRMALTVTLYLALFAVAGKWFDAYWGALYTPLLTLGIIWFPAAARDLWRGLRLPATAPASTTA